MSTTYHGPQPVTKTDIKMAKKHLKDTLKIKKDELKLNQSKIEDHKEAAEDASDPKSVSYNKSHIDGHMKDNKAIQKIIDQRQSSVKTVNSLKPVSKGLAMFMGKKKYGAKNMAAMAKKG